MVGLQRSQQEMIRSFVSTDDEKASTSAGPPHKKVKRRCYMCPSKLARKIKQACETCNRNICSEHSVTTLNCLNCLKETNQNSSDSQ